mgnify:CR=1 FL=1
MLGASDLPSGCRWRGRSVGAALERVVAGVVVAEPDARHEVGRHLLVGAGSSGRAPAARSAFSCVFCPAACGPVARAAPRRPSGSGRSSAGRAISASSRMRVDAAIECEQQVLRRRRSAVTKCAAPRSRDAVAPGGGGSPCSSACERRRRRRARAEPAASPPCGSLSTPPASR